MLRIAVMVCVISNDHVTLLENLPCSPLRILNKPQVPLPTVKGPPQICPLGLHLPHPTCPFPRCSNPAQLSQLAVPTRPLVLLCLLRLWAFPVAPPSLCPPPAYCPNLPLHLLNAYNLLGTLEAQS